jgi:putative membrane protein
MGGGGGWFMMFFWLVVLVAFLWIAWAIARRGGFGSAPAAREDRAEALLRERYARGEIDEATYRRMLDELRRP